MQRQVCGHLVNLIGRRALAAAVWRLRRHAHVVDALIRRRTRRCAVGDGRHRLLRRLADAANTAAKNESRASCRAACLPVGRKAGLGAALTARRRLLADAVDALIGCVAASAAARLWRLANAVDALQRGDQQRKTAISIDTAHLIGCSARGKLAARSRLLRLNWRTRLGARAAANVARIAASGWSMPTTHKTNGSLTLDRRRSRSCPWCTASRSR